MLKITRKWLVKYCKLKKGDPKSQRINSSIIITTDTETTAIIIAKGKLEAEYTDYEILITDIKQTT
jgi:hypothetical protein